jgi:GntP family permease
MNATFLPLVAALIAIIVLVILVTFCRVHPFLSLLIVSISLGLACQLPPAEVMKQFEKGFGETLSFVGIVIGLGTMLGGLLVFLAEQSDWQTRLFQSGVSPGFPGRYFSQRFWLGYRCFLRLALSCWYRWHWSLLIRPTLRF